MAFLLVVKTNDVGDIGTWVYNLSLNKFTFFSALKISCFFYRSKYIRALRCPRIIVVPNKRVAQKLQAKSLIQTTKQCMNKVTNIKIFLTEHTVGVIDNKFRSIKQYFNNEIYVFQKKNLQSNARSPCSLPSTATRTFLLLVFSAILTPWRGRAVNWYLSEPAVCMPQRGASCEERARNHEIRVTQYSGNVFWGDRVWLFSGIARVRVSQTN